MLSLSNTNSDRSSDHDATVHVDWYDVFVARASITQITNFEPKIKWFKKSSINLARYISSRRKIRTLGAFINRSDRQILTFHSFNLIELLEAEQFLFRHGSSTPDFEWRRWCNAEGWATYRKQCRIPMSIYENQVQVAGNCAERGELTKLTAWPVTNCAVASEKLFFYLSMNC